MNLATSCNIFATCMSCFLHHLVTSTENRVMPGSFSVLTYGPQRKKTCLWGFVNNKGADQTDQCLCFSLIGKYHI